LDVDVLKGHQSLSGGSESKGCVGKVLKDCQKAFLGRAVPPMKAADSVQTP
jgi:hypothetical protein